MTNEIKHSAYQHGFGEPDIRHAIANAIRVWPMDGYDMLIGPTWSGHLIEVGVNREADVFHAMAARPKFL